MGCDDVNWHNCYWNNECEDTGDEADFEEWLDCWLNTSSYCYEMDPTGDYYSCYAYGYPCEDEFWYNCYWYSDCDNRTEADFNPQNFTEYIECYTVTYGECNDYDGAWFNCYNYGEGCEDPTWFDCYYYAYNCDGNLTDADYSHFDNWLECYLATYGECGAKHSEHYDCYWENEGC